MANLPGPYEIEYQLDGWTNPTRSHRLRFSCAIVGTPEPGELPEDVVVQKSGGGTDTLDVVADQMWSFLRPMYHTSIQATSYTLWKYLMGTYSKDFISTGELASPAGTSSTTIQQAHQLTLTFRSATGGIMKLVALEGTGTGDTRLPLIVNATGSAHQKFAAYVLSNDNFWLSADDSYPVVALRDSRGQNERIWRKIFRQN